MVDFRYHLVSLISVFLALSVGIILGAGPLQNSIGEALTGEVASLRSSNADLKAYNEELSEIAEANDAAYQALAPTLLANTLTGRSVTVVRAPGVSDATFASVSETLALTGATTAQTITLTDVWTSSEQQSYRAAFSGQIAGYVSQATPDLSADEILAQAVTQIASEGAGSEQNSTLVPLLTEADNPLLSLEGSAGTVVDAVLFLTADIDMPATSDKDAAPTEAVALVEAQRDMFTTLAHTLHAHVPTLVVGRAASDYDVVTSVRNAGGISTVDTPDTQLGALNAGIALGHVLAAHEVHLGVGVAAADITTEPVSAAADQNAPAAPTS